ncbi:Nif3-like dinuclear metal center hexameric protein [Bacillus toyonensis]|uniref:Nif3-like dinuclear metal center hexameric protein n=2 Tax=Bacillus cereus group TaxID=86661 RepID=UPI0002793E6C|nr:hypothetical protein IGK_05220 [Bacillus toyonensis]
MKMIKEWQSIFTIAELCSIFDISRATYYRWKKQEKTVTNHEEKTVIEICQHHKYRYGYRRVTACLRDQFNIVMNHKKVLRIMRKYNVLSRVRKKKKIFVLGHEPVVAKNRIQRRFKATKPNEKWFTDITYLMFGNKTLYFSSIIDGFLTSSINNEDLVLICNIEEKSTSELTSHLKEIFDIPYVDFEGKNINNVKKIAIVAGCGDKVSWMEEAEKRGVQAYITGEIHCHIDNEYGKQRYKQMMDYVSNTSMSLIGVSHSASEYLVHKTLMKEWFENNFDIETVLIPQEKWWL